MRKIIVPAVVSAALAVSSFAFASEIATGKIMQINTSAKTITLDDGVLYHLPHGLKMTSLKPGEQVTVIWTMEDGRYVASDVKPTSL